MREKAPTEAPICNITVSGKQIPVFINTSAWQQWFAQGLDLYRTKDRYIDPKFVNYGKYEPQNPYTGLVAFADGINWDPGEGEGNYIYENGGWVYIVNSDENDISQYMAPDYHAQIQSLMMRIDDLGRQLSTVPDYKMQIAKLLQRIESLENTVSMSVR